MMLKTGDKILFNKEKELTYIKSLGKGAYGETHLFYDKIIDMNFAIKKYTPRYKNHSEEEYSRFIDEVKILFNLSHSNIVRIYDYYLFPDERTGYLKMEYIKGITLDKFICSAVCDWNDIFIQTVNAFQYMEEHRVIHGDIRPDNIMVDENGQVKIIDFGFGKLLTPDEDGGKDAFIYWTIEQLPKEIKENKIYTHQTDIYFLGMLFKSLSIDNNISFPFLYNDIIEIMTAYNPNNRYKSFNEVIAAINNAATVEFISSEWIAYRRFTDVLSGMIDYYNDNVYFYDNIDKTIKGLAESLRVNTLEEYIQGNGALVNCFIHGSYSLKDDVKVTRDTVKEFYNIFTNMTEEKQEVMIDSIKNRLKDKRIIYIDSLPF